MSTLEIWLIILGMLGVAGIVSGVIFQRKINSLPCVNCGHIARYHGWDGCLYCACSLTLADCVD